jgi:hypothetical protein
MHIPPGISVLVTTISQASLLPLALGILDHFVLRPYQVHRLPAWVTVVACFLSPLVAFSIRVLSGDLIIYMRARRVGAVLPPHNPTWVPGAMNRIISGLKREETVYLGIPPGDFRMSYPHCSFKVTSSKIRPKGSATP